MIVQLKDVAVRGWVRPWRPSGPPRPRCPSWGPRPARRGAAAERSNLAAEAAAAQAAAEASRFLLEEKRPKSWAEQAARCWKENQHRVFFYTRFHVWGREDKGMHSYWDCPEQLNSCFLFCHFIKLLDSWRNWVSEHAVQKNWGMAPAENWIAEHVAVQMWINNLLRKKTVASTNVWLIFFIEIPRGVRWRWLR